MKKNIRAISTYLGTKVLTKENFGYVALITYFAAHIMDIYDSKMSLHLGAICGVCLLIFLIKIIKEDV